MSSISQAGLPARFMAACSSSFSVCELSSFGENGCAYRFSSRLRPPAAFDWVKARCPLCVASSPCSVAEAFSTIPTSSCTNFWTSCFTRLLTNASSSSLGFPGKLDCSTSNDCNVPTAERIAADRLCKTVSSSCLDRSINFQIVPFTSETLFSSCSSSARPSPSSFLSKASTLTARLLAVSISARSTNSLRRSAKETPKLRLSWNSRAARKLSPSGNGSSCCMSSCNHSGALMVTLARSCERCGCSSSRLV
mmetsp:Transcript_12316/g.42707  ORF Transcript_12316/g.42707 Transcript_12316/m.42707 type:complete len:251 (-) Transcript_12316:529-1281(-)